ncbi:hypothetical protein PS6_011659, partial [Mucor atramentarius]
MRIVADKTILSDLMNSLSSFGKVLQVKKFTHMSYFEGKLSVMLDTSARYQEGDSEYQEARLLGCASCWSFLRHSGHIRAKCPELAKRRCFKCGKQGHMLRFCPEKEVDQASYLKKKKVSHQAEASEEVIMARDAAAKMMDTIDEEKMRQNKEENEDENLKTDSDEIAFLQGEIHDESENDKSTDGESLEDKMEDLQGESHQNKYTKDEDMQDEEIILAGAANKSTAARSSAYSKYAPNSIGMSMQVDKREEMLGMTSLRQETQ